MLGSSPEMTVLVGIRPIPPSRMVMLSDTNVLKLISVVYVTTKSLTSISAPLPNCQDRRIESTETLEALKFSGGLSGTMQIKNTHYSKMWLNITHCNFTFVSQQIQLICY